MEKCHATVLLFGRYKKNKAIGFHNAIYTAILCVGCDSFNIVRKQLQICRQFHGNHIAVCKGGIVG